MTPPRPAPTRSRILVSTAAALVLLGVLICSVWKRPAAPAPPETVRITGETMATTFQVKVVVPAADTATVAALSAAVETELAAVDATLSRFRESSDIDRLNRLEQLDWVPVAPETVEVLDLARTVSERSGGAFDVTVGPLVGLWGFHRGQALDVEPDRDEIAALREDVGYTLLELDPDTPAVRKARPGVQLDLSAIAKGYGVDRLAEALEALGQAHYLVEVGGEVRAGGHNAAGEPWRIGIERPLDEGRGVHRALTLTDKAMATSGDYRSFYELGGRRFSHAIDPRTGRPVQHGLASVTVIHERCAAADAWATALMVLGPDEGLEVAQREGLAALFLTRMEGGTFSEQETPAFSRSILTQEASAP